MNRHYPLVAGRAAHFCEYCGAPEAAINFHFEVEHILPLALGGTDNADNLALACQSCNIFKSDQMTAMDWLTESEMPLFHPRLMRWEDHFTLETETALLIGLTAIGRVTVVALHINSAAQVRARRLWLRIGLLP